MREKQNQGVLVLIAIFIPPLAVYFEDGCGAQLAINILLCFFGYLPAIIHAVVIILLRKPEQNRDLESGGQQRSANESQNQQAQQQPQQQQQNQLQPQNKPQETSNFPEPPKYPDDQPHYSAPTYEKAP
ncbi:Plasma membrane proteolipid 3 [Zancudomyces culisetae]|uniref:Plasma membrane proteolipid 3 n=1 Tax=Zancudomyces culisetae TaxID=1213189 RepID=A0A1R1PZ40_ZANCU|nr:Plasma membrane proteolipid 3 [Zancudomyces culisetae]|eukprot:OMH86228.1 Plasma membrane proteolipid 3 [Zancudomyces culisetae]